MFVLNSLKDFEDYIGTFKGNPKVKLEIIPLEGKVIIYYHKQHRRRFKRSNFNPYTIAGIWIIFNHASHKFLREGNTNE